MRDIADLDYDTEFHINIVSSYYVLSVIFDGVCACACARVHDLQVICMFDFIQLQANSLSKIVFLSSVLKLEVSGANRK